MKQAHNIWIIAILIFILPLIAIAEEKTDAQIKSESITDNPDTTLEVTLSPDRYVITYYHGNRRCMTCEKLEAYATEAVKKGFAEELKEGKVVWQTVNYDEEANEHVKKDYGIFSQSLIVSHIVEEEVTEWTNLKKIWDLVGDKENYIKYVQVETKHFMTPKTKE